MLVKLGSSSPNIRGENEKISETTNTGHVFFLPVTNPSKTKIDEKIASELTKPTYRHKNDEKILPSPPGVAAHGTFLTTESQICMVSVRRALGLPI